MDKKLQGKENFEWGHYAEQLAAEYLLKNGYTIRERNWRLGKTVEIDIIAESGLTVVFIEVKTRKGDNQQPLDAIDDKKIRRLCRGADAYLRGMEGLRPYRFDIIAFTGTPGSHTMSHIMDAFMPPLVTSGVRSVPRGPEIVKG